MKYQGTFTKIVILSGIIFSSTFCLAGESFKIPYYGNEFYSLLQKNADGEEITKELNSILKSTHISQANQMDQIVNGGCSQSQGRCYRHYALGYDKAREILLGGYYLVKEGNSYGIKDVYCNEVRPASDFGRGEAPAPGSIPDGTIVNTEHTWPQSRFTGKHPIDYQKSDMHHLFPTDSQMNSTRSSLPFGEVAKDDKILRCPESRVGRSTQGRGTVFEPPANHQGNVARALFYFSVRYNLNISSDEETILRKWHKEDPVDDEEAIRNNEIFKYQGNRNPFIDHPDLVDSIQNF